MQARAAIRLDDSTNTDLRSRSSSLSPGKLPSSVSRRNHTGGLSTVALTARSYAAPRDRAAFLREIVSGDSVEGVAVGNIGETGFEPAPARPPAECATRLRHSPWGLHSDESAVALPMGTSVRIDRLGSMA